MPLARRNKRDDQIILGGEVVVKAGLGHARLGDDPVNPDAAIPHAVKQRPGGGKDAGAGR